MGFTFVLNILLRWAHIAGAIMVLGGLFRAYISGLYAVDKYRHWLTAGALALVVSGGWQFIQKMNAAPGGWHILMGIKILLGLHVIAVSLLLSREGLNEAKRARMARGAVISGWIVVLLGAIVHNLK
jgi:hypothetical protein